MAVSQALRLFVDGLDGCVCGLGSPLARIQEEGGRSVGSGIEIRVPTFTDSRKGVPGLGGEVGDLVENCRYQLG